jgi:hypothetical protein
MPVFTLRYSGRIKNTGMSHGPPLDIKYVQYPLWAKRWEQAPWLLGLAQGGCVYSVWLIAIGPSEPERNGLHWAV